MSNEKIYWKEKQPQYTSGLLREKYNQFKIHNAQTNLRGKKKGKEGKVAFQSNKVQRKKALISRIVCSHPLKLLKFCHLSCIGYGDVVG